MEYPRLTAAQLEELEKRLLASETDTAAQMGTRKIEATPAMTLIEFHANEYLRRLIEDMKVYRSSLNITE